MIPLIFEGQEGVIATVADDGFRPKTIVDHTSAEYEMSVRTLLFVVRTLGRDWVV